jgi:hypothetical protein
VRIADDRRLRDLSVGDERALNLRRSHAVTRDVDDVVYPAGDPVVTISVAATAVAGELFSGVGREIGLHKPFVVAE